MVEVFVDVALIPDVEHVKQFVEGGERISRVVGGEVLTSVFVGLRRVGATEPAVISTVTAVTDGTGGTAESGLTSEQWKAVNTALFGYWTSREDARLAQVAKGTSDIGGRLGVTAGGHLDRVAQMLGRICIAAGAPRAKVYYNAPKGDPEKTPGRAIGYTLPGYYRPTKQWDCVVYHDDEPIVIIELKSQNGPSYGNNANNRAEEALGNALDLQRAMSEGLIPGQPWTGYAFVIEDDLYSQLQRGANDRGNFPKDVLFNDWSYLSRVQHLCQRLQESNLYSAVWAVKTSRPTCPATTKDPDRCPQIKYEIDPHEHVFNWNELDPEVSGFARFAAEMSAQVTRYYPDGPQPESDPVRPARRPRVRIPAADDTITMF